MIMLRRQILTILSIITIATASYAQSIVYSQPDKDDQKSESFDIVGKIGALSHLQKFKVEKQRYRS